MLSVLPVRIQLHVWRYPKPVTVSTIVVPSIPRLTLAANLRDIDLNFIRQNAQAIMRGSPIQYVKNARLTGSLFDDGLVNGSGSLADTGFFVDHAEPLEILESMKSTSRWPLGKLLEGHEFIMLTRVN